MLLKKMRRSIAVKKRTSQQRRMVKCSESPPGC